VTDQDIRDDDIYSLIINSASSYPLSDLDDQMEVLLMQLHAEAGPQNPSSFNLVINHKHCIASYVYQEMKDENFHLFDPNTLNRKRRLYWNYLWRHPAHISTPQRAIPDASDALTWYYTDNLISASRSVVPFSKPECEDLSRVVQEMSQPWNDTSVAKTVFLAWLLREVCSFRDSEYYGQFTQKSSEAVRQSKILTRNSVSRPPRLISVLNLLMNLLFFGIPHTYYAHVKASSEYRGRLASVKQNWEAYIERLVREYSHFLLISTVLLSATVGFVSAPNIAAPAKVSATISAFASLGSLIVGVFSIWRHQSNTSTADSFTYMYNVQHSYLGLHGHAILLSLPPVLLVWAIVAFAISIVAYTVQGLTDVDSLHLASAWTVLGVFAILLAAVTAALYTFSMIWRFQRKSWRFTDCFTRLFRKENNIVP